MLFENWVLRYCVEGRGTTSGFQHVILIIRWAHCWWWWCGRHGSPESSLQEHWLRQSAHVLWRQIALNKAFKALFHNPVRSDRQDLAVLTGAPCGALKVLFLKSFVVMQSRIFELRREDDYVCGARKVSWWPEWSATALGCSHQKTAASGYGLKAVATYCPICLSTHEGRDFRVVLWFPPLPSGLPDHCPD